MATRCWAASLAVVLLAIAASDCARFAVALGASGPAELSYVPPGWLRRQRVAANVWVPVTLAVTQPGATQLAATCRSVSDPASDAYGQYLTRDAVAELLGARGNHDAVVAWLRGVGARDVRSTSTLDFVSASVPAGQIETAFGVHLHEYARVRQGVSGHGVEALVHQRCVRATTHVILPPALVPLVDLVMGVSDFPLDAQRPTASLEHVARAPVSTRHLRAGAHDRVATAAAFPAPDVSYAYVSDTEARFVLTQACVGGTGQAPTTPPCANTSQPVTKYQSMCSYNGLVPTDVPWSNVLLQCSYANDGCAYLVTVPHTYSSGQLVNCSFRAVTGAGVSPWAALPWKGVPASKARLITTPLVTPPFMHNFYGLPAAPATAGATQAVAAFTGNYYMPSDLSTFYTMYNVSHTGQLLQHGPNLPQYPKPEGTLDIEWLTATAPSADTTFWYQEGNTTTRRGTFVLGLAMAVSNDPSPPMLFSVSYGGTETFFTKLAGPQYIPRCNVEFQKMCARGITIVAAAGDAGATSFGHGSESCAIDAYFPGSSPWVTAVSATFVSRSARARPNTGASGAGEAAVTVGNYMGWSTGGGFSNEPTCEQPWYQKAAVAEYLQRNASGMPPRSMFNASLRAYPDIAALGHNVMTVTDTIVQPADGTSAATPMIAGILTRLNQARIAKGLPQIGLANPLLYAARHNAPAAFYDIVGPANNKCGSFVCCPNGFEVTPGFDAVTGLGTVGDYAALEAYAVSTAARARARALRR